MKIGRTKKLVGMVNKRGLRDLRLESLYQDYAEQLGNESPFRPFDPQGAIREEQVRDSFKHAYKIYQKIIYSPERQLARLYKLNAVGKAIDHHKVILADSKAFFDSFVVDNTTILKNNQKFFDEKNKMSQTMIDSEIDNMCTSDQVDISQLGKALRIYQEEIKLAHEEADINVRAIKLNEAHEKVRKHLLETMIGLEIDGMCASDQIDFSEVGAALRAYQEEIKSAYLEKIPNTRNIILKGVYKKVQTYISDQKSLQFFKTDKTKQDLEAIGAVYKPEGLHSWGANLVWTLAHIGIGNTFIVCSDILAHQYREGKAYQNANIPCAFAREVCVLLKAGYTLYKTMDGVRLEPTGLSLRHLRRCDSTGALGNGVNPTYQEIEDVYRLLREAKWGEKETFQCSFNFKHGVAIQLLPISPSLFLRLRTRMTGFQFRGREARSRVAAQQNPNVIPNLDQVIPSSNEMTSESMATSSNAFGDASKRRLAAVQTELSSMRQQNPVSSTNVLYQSQNPGPNTSPTIQPQTQITSPKQGMLEKIRSSWRKKI